MEMRLIVAAVALGVVGAFVLGPVTAQPRRSEITHPARGHESPMSAPAVAVSRDGAAVVAWISQEQHRNIVYVSRAGDPPVRVTPDNQVADALHQAPGLATGPGGEAYVTWSASKPKPAGALFVSDLYLSRSIDGGRTFDRHLRLNDERPISHSFEGLAVTADGTVLVAWIDTREGPNRPRTWLARVGDRGTRVDGVQRLDPEETCVCCRISVACADDAAAVVWRKVFPADVRDMVVATSRDRGRTFSPATLVHDDGWKITACPHRGGSVAFAGPGRLVTAWYTEGRSGQPEVSVAASTDGRTFSAPQRLQETVGTIPDHVRLAANAQGHVAVVWEESTAVRRRVMMRTSTDGGRTFAQGQSLSRALKAYMPDVAAASSGEFVVVWHEEQFPATKTVVHTVRAVAP
jgi:hypothetical protein